LDYCLTLSDHCDYTELLTVVKKCDPDMIYTFHGFADQFALSLTKMGYNAASINRKKRST
jgi:putative mRNA 3-end processing factor